MASVAPLFDDGGIYIGFVNCVQDITDRKRSEFLETEAKDALRVAKRSLRDNDRTLSSLNRVNTDLVESGELLKGILNSVSDCIEVLDSEGRIQFMNHAGQQAMGVDDFDIIGFAIRIAERFGGHLSLRGDLTGFWNRYVPQAMF